jgi:hypothetical protein
LVTSWAPPRSTTPQEFVGAILETTNPDGSTTVKMAGVTDGGIGLTANDPTTTCSSRPNSKLA